VREIALHAAAPEKPKTGDPCNGCGVCCALTTCPLGRLRFLKRRGPCPALRWDSALVCYRCDLVTRPGEYLRWLPPLLLPAWTRFMARRIAAGSGCDCDAQLD
jgi:hypothetical protein